MQGVKQWAPFIENRVSVIRKAKLVDKFRYINTFSNPADLLTRGLTFEKLSTSKLWWNGPDINYLSLEVDEDCDSILDSTAIEFMNVHVSNITPAILVDTGRFSSLKKLTKVLYFVMKFVKNCRKENFEYEYNSLLHALIQQEQRTYFSNELKLINGNKRVSTFKTLKLCVHSDLIVVQTRFLDHPELSRHLILLSHKSPLTSLIVQREHEVGLHCGIKQTLANLRLHYWVVQGKKTVRRIIRNCYSCNKMGGEPYSSPAFAPLPDFRCDRVLPFAHIGIDFAGPFSVKANLTWRSNAYLKAYICLFVCASSRALHLEITLDLSTDSFLETFRRFVAVRGAPNTIYTDNGKNFEASSKLISTTINGSLNGHAVIEDLARHKIAWSFIPPRSPWWGGFYERMVQMLKKGLKRTMSEKGLNYLQFETMVKRIEGVINDRPLITLDDDPNQLIITPSTLILG